MSLSFVLAEALNPGRVSGGDYVLNNYPLVVFSGNPGVFLSSNDGLAHFTCSDFYTAISLLNSNAFVVGDHSLLSFKQLQVVANPIKQQSLLFSFEGIQLLDRGIDPSSIPGFSDISRYVLVNALQLKRQKDKEAFKKLQEAAIAQAKEKARQKKEPAKKKPIAHQKAPIPKHRCPIDDDDMNDTLLRALHLPTTFDQIYAAIVFAPVLPLNGNLLFVGTTINNVHVDAGTAFNIVLQDGAQLTQGSSNTSLLSLMHIINIKGTNNVINVTGQMSIGPDTLFFAKNAELTFNFVNNGSGTPQLHIDAGVKLMLERDDILRFTGEGEVIWGDGTLIRFKGVRQGEEVSFRPQLIVTNDATMSLADHAHMRMKGVGRIEVSNRGKIDLSRPSTIAIGLDRATLIGPDGCPLGCPPISADHANDIELNVFATGEVTLGPITGADKARISWKHTTSRITFENAGLLFIDANGIFEINADGQTVKPGVLQELSFSHGGALYVNETGIFAMASNRQTINPMTGHQVGFVYDGLFASIEGDGSAAFIPGPGETGLSGQLNPVPGAFQRFSSITSRELIQLLLGF